MKSWEEKRACWESQKQELEQKVEDGEEKAEKLEKYGAIEKLANLNGTKMRVVRRMLTPPPLFVRYWQEAQTLCRVVSQRLADAQSQSESFEIKYNKAKRLVREYQSRYFSSIVVYVTILLWCEVRKP